MINCSSPFFILKISFLLFSLRVFIAYPIALKSFIRNISFKNDVEFYLWVANQVAALLSISSWLNTLFDLFNMK